MLLYLLMYCRYLHKGFALLRSRPYNAFRVGNVLVRVQVSHLSSPQQLQCGSQAEKQRSHQQNMFACHWFCCLLVCYVASAAW